MPRLYSICDTGMFQPVPSVIANLLIINY